jgi:hypothetical protein
MPTNIITVNNAEELEWTVSDSKMPAILSVLDAIGERTWLLCDSDVADEFRIMQRSGEWSDWLPMPDDLKGKTLYNGFSDIVQHRCRNK